MASIDRFRPTREGYQPPAISQARPPAQAMPASSGSLYQPPAPAASPSSSAFVAGRQSHSPASASRQYDVPPAVPSPPTHSSRTSPPRSAPRKGLLSPRAQKQQQTSSSFSSSASPQQRMAMAASAMSAARSGAVPPAAPQPPAPQQQDQPPLASQWYFTEEELVSTPSVVDGLSPAEERARRAKGVNFIYQAGIAVQPNPLPQMTLYVAAVFFHRFYMRVSMVEERGGIHHYKIAATSLFLANKTEENCLKTKHLIIAVAKVAQKNLNLIIDEQSKEYWRWRDSILANEELMLEMLTFDLVVANPYEQLWAQLRRLDQLSCKPVRAAAWAFLNDAALTALPLLLDASDIASASIFFASVASGEKLEDVRGEPWWRWLRADERRLARAIEVMAAFYRENPLKKQQQQQNNSGAAATIGGLRDGAGGGGGGGHDAVSSGGILQAVAGSPVFHLEATRRQPQDLSQLESNGGGRSHSRERTGRGSSLVASRDVTPIELDASSSTGRGSSRNNNNNHTKTQTQTQTQTQQSEGTAVLSQSNGSQSTAATTTQAESDGTATLASQSQTVPGDSDALLKAAANNLDEHSHNGAASPSKKRKSSLPEAGNANIDDNSSGSTPADDSHQPQAKRQKWSSED